MHVCVGGCRTFAYIFQTKQRNTAGFRVERLAVRMTDMLSVMHMHIQMRSLQLRTWLADIIVSTMSRIRISALRPSERDKATDAVANVMDEHSKLACVCFIGVAASFVIHPHICACTG